MLVQNPVFFQSVGVFCGGKGKPAPEEMAFHHMGKGQLTAATFGDFVPDEVVQPVEVDVACTGVVKLEVLAYLVKEGSVVKNGNPQGSGQVGIFGHVT